MSSLITLLFLLGYQLAVNFAGSLPNAVAPIYIQSFFAICAGISLGKLVLKPTAREAAGSKHYLTLFAIFFVLALLSHLRLDPFFYWDEWHVIERFQKQGLPGVIYTHNEHFLPVFFSFYYLEILLLKDHYLRYLVVSLFLHALNTLLLYRLLCTLSSPERESSKIPLAISLIYMLSSLHCEVLEWSFVQCVLLAETATLIALNGTLDFLKKGKKTALAVTLISLALAPFLFGNGFSAVFQVLLLVFLVGIWSDKSQFMPRLKSALLLSALVAVVFVGTFLIYTSQKSGSAPKIEAAGVAANFQAILAYMFVGGEYGTVLRGLGLFPSLENAAAEYWLSPRLRAILNPEIFFALIGAVLSATILLVSLLLGDDKRRSFRLWLLGQLIILSVFSLPAIGRWQFGIAQSLSLRYQCAAITGLCIMLLPFFEGLINFSKNRFGESRGFVIVQLFLCYYIAVHLVLGVRFNYFTEKGVTNRLFIAQLKDWNSLLREESGGKPVAYEGTGTKLAGKYPRLPDTVTPGRHPDEIYLTLHRLNPERYPLRSEN